ncbi:hypothetical protein LTR36_000150 [Oleoguttula mirabilis]|uniref:DUF7605 domain-containing protein n=1 Tax=Oleoguttula mirabilis TaxID=1507867 RepID=A0AAV9JYA3_9PEZI|nr:hypothetical protein LTR36_000150 [Oleoguttula mirabilis]
MDSDRESSAHSDPEEQMALNRSIKRSASPLFVSEDGDVDVDGDHTNKRTKFDHAATSVTAAPQEGKLTADGMVPGYNAAKQEGRPRLAMYHPSFKVAEKMVMDICDEFRNVAHEVGAGGYSNPELEVISEGASGLKHYRSLPERYPSVRPVGCLGSSGVGKSSFLNSILSQKKAALESGDDRGTYVVHEYMSSQRLQAALYEVHVPYLRSSQIKKLVEKHFENIVAYQDCNDDLDDGEKDELQGKSETALDFFCALLCDQADFESVDDAETYFDSRRSDEDAEVIDDLAALIEKFLLQRDLDDSVEVFTAQTEGELSEIFKRVSRPSKARQPSPWPLINRVQIHQKNDLLDAGVVLADTAGVTDTNMSVVDNTLRYLKRAGTVLVFSGHKRIEKDPLIDSHLRQAIQMGKLHNTVLVVTMIDTKEVYNDTTKEELPEAEKALLEQAERRLADLKAEETKLIGKRRSATDKDFRAIQARLEDLEGERALAGNAVKQVSVQIRCREIKEKMKGRLKKLDKSKTAPELPIYFISSRTYQQHVDGYDPREPPTLDLAGTGIPALRHMLYDIPARGKMNTLSRVCTSRLPNIFQGILGILTKSKLERKDEVEKLIRKIFLGFGPLVGEVVVEVREQFKERILKTIKENEPKWMEKAEKLLSGWAKMKSVTFTAFCRRSGHWRVPNKDYVSWNALLQGLFDSKLVAVFDLFHEDLDGAESAAVTSLTLLFKSLEDRLESCDDFQGVDMSPFFAFARDARDEVLNKVADLFVDLRVQVNEIRHSATLDTSKSYVGLAMQDTYQKCLQMQAANFETNEKKRKVHKGVKPHQLRVDCIRDRLTGNVEVISVFAEVAKLAGAALEEDLKEWEIKCRAVVSSGSKRILGDFQARYTVSEVKEEENPEAVRRLQEAGRKALDAIEGPLREHVERCEAYENGEG